jgi:hypothetical protein
VAVQLPAARRIAPAREIVATGGIKYVRTDQLNDGPVSMGTVVIRAAAWSNRGKAQRSGAMDLLEKEDNKRREDNVPFRFTYRWQWPVISSRFADCLFVDRANNRSAVLD